MITPQTGWGQLKSGYNQQTSDELMKVSLNITFNKICDDLRDDELQDSETLRTQICVGGEPGKVSLSGVGSFELKLSYNIFSEILLRILVKGTGKLYS